MLTCRRMMVSKAVTDNSPSSSHINLHSGQVINAKEKEKKHLWLDLFMYHEVIDSDRV
jgi:hypothetical protein